MDLPEELVEKLTRLNEVRKQLAALREEEAQLDAECFDAVLPYLK